MTRKIFYHNAEYNGFVIYMTGTSSVLGCNLRGKDFIDTSQIHVRKVPEENGYKIYAIRYSMRLTKAIDCYNMFLKIL